MDKFRVWLLTGLVVGGGVARGAGDTDPIEVLDPMGTGRACLVKGGVCATVGAAGTVALESAPVAATAARKAPVPVVTDFSRARAAAPAQPWVLELDAYLGKPALAGNALFLFYDLEEPTAIAQHEVTSLFQAKVLPGRALAARVRLSPEDGFRAGHQYRVQIAQLIGGKEVVLAHGDFSLR